MCDLLKFWEMLVLKPRIIYCFPWIASMLDSVLKSRDITLPTKVSIVKTIVFSVVMYRCEIWTIKKAEHHRIDAF